MSTLTHKFRDKFRSILMIDQNMLILAALLGFLAGFASTFFRWMIEFFEIIFSIKGLSIIGISPQLYPFLLPLMPMLGGCFIGLICKYLPNAVKENGVHQVMYAVALNDGKVRKRTITTCAVTSPTIFMLVISRSSRLIPGFRGIPAVMMTILEPCVSW